MISAEGRAKIVASNHARSRAWRLVPVGKTGNIRWELHCPPCATRVRDRGFYTVLVPGGDDAVAWLTHFGCSCAACGTRP